MMNYIYECNHCGFEGSKYDIIQHLLIDKIHPEALQEETHND